MQLFGRAKKAAPTAKDSIIKMRETLEMLEKREKFLQGKIDNELKIAKANAAKNKRRTHSLFIMLTLLDAVALMALKRKKTYEAHVDKILGARMTIETQVMTIESANVNLEAMNAMKAGADAMKSIHGAMYAAY